MEFRIQERFVIAQSWWIATELVRRNPQLRILELHPGGGQYETLGIFDTFAEEEIIHMIRSGGRIHFMKAPDTEPIEWSEVFSSSPHVMVERIERLGGLTPPAQTPPTERHVLTYRLIATILAQMVNAKATWDARSAFVDTAGYGGGTVETVFDDFPSAARRRETAGRVAVLGNAAYAFWSLNRNEEAVAVLDEWGWLHHRKNTQAVDLMQIYKASGRSLTASVGQSLGGILK
jgi:hypothetical protein